MDKYPQPKKPYIKRSKLAKCCQSRMGTVKTRHQGKHKPKPGFEIYECKSGTGWHYRSKRV